MSAADTGNLYFEGVPLPLQETMWRVGANLRAADFVENIVETFREVEVVADDQVHARFRAGRPYRDFVALLHDAVLSGMRLLVIGCGRGLAGRAAAYAERVVRDTCGQDIGAIDSIDLTPRVMQELRRPYDVVVTHSLLHFLLDPKPVCRLIREMIVPGGTYLMANEPNARFWANPECVRAMNLAAGWESRRKYLSKYTDPSRYLARLRRLAHPGEPHHWVDRMNAILRQRLGLSADLTAKEIVRIIDPHLPDQYPGEFPMGSQGLSWAQLESGPLAGLHIERVRTCGYVLRDNPDTIPQRWRALDERLTAQYPLDGCSFSALWRKPF